MGTSEQGSGMEELRRLRELAAICYAGLVAECGLPEKWADVFFAASSGEPFSTEGLLPFVASACPQPEARGVNGILGKLPAQIQNPEAWPPNYAAGWNDCARITLDEMTAAAGAAPSAVGVDATRYRIFRDWWFKYWTLVNYEDEVSSATTSDELDAAIDALAAKDGAK